MSLFPAEYQKLIAKRIQELRLERGYTQEEMTKRAGIKLATYKIFEQTGRISLQRLYQISIVIHRQQELEGLFKPLPIRSISQLVSTKKRLRGRRVLK